jgi:outer membrane protein
MSRSLIAITVLLAVLSLSSTAMAQSAMKIGVVNLQRAINEVSEGKKARANLESRMEKIKAEVDKRRKELETMQESLEAGEMMLSDEALTEKRTAFQTKYYEFQQMVVGSEQEMTQLQSELTNDLLEKLYKVARSVGAESGYNLVLESTAVVYTNGVADITDLVIARFNDKK